MTESALNEPRVAEQYEFDHEMPRLSDDPTVVRAATPDIYQPDPTLIAELADSTAAPRLPDEGAPLQVTPMPSEFAPPLPGSVTADPGVTPPRLPDAPAVATPGAAPETADLPQLGAQPVAGAPTLSGATPTAPTDLFATAAAAASDRAEASAALAQPGIALPVPESLSVPVANSREVSPAAHLADDDAAPIGAAAGIAEPAPGPATASETPEHPMAHLMPKRQEQSEASKRAAEIRAAKKRKAKKNKIVALIGVVVFAAVVGPFLIRWVVNAVNEAGSTTPDDPPAVEQPDTESDRGGIDELLDDTRERVADANNRSQP